MRRAWRSAQRLGAETDLLWVSDHEPSEDVAAAKQRVADERGTTFVLMGTPRPRGALRRLTSQTVRARLMALPGIDLRIVADRTKRPRRSE